MIARSLVVVRRHARALGAALEHHAEVLGGFEEQAAARSRVIAVAVAGLIAIFLLLQAAFASWRLAILSFLTLPMALAGAALAAVVTGGEITLGSVAGFVAVVAIAVRGMVVLVRHYQRLEADGMDFGPELVTAATSDRVAPILTTAIGAAVVFIPFAVIGGAGFEIVGPMAAVILGGLISSTLLTLLVLPAAYLRFGFVAEPDRSAEDLIVRIPDVDTVGR